MGKGRHQIIAREELLKKYNRINKVKQVLQIIISSRIYRNSHLFRLCLLMHIIQGHILFFSISSCSLAFLLGTARTSKVSAEQEPKLHCTL